MEIFSTAVNVVSSPQQPGPDQDGHQRLQLQRPLYEHAQ